MNLVMRVSETVHVLDFGELIASGTPDEVQREPRGDRGVSRREWSERCRAARADRCRGLATAPSRRCTACRSRSRRARSWPILGANGAGKTTTLRAVSGTVRDERRDPSSTAAGSRGTRPRRSRGSGSPTCRRAAGSTPSSPSGRTCCLGASSAARPQGRQGRHRPRARVLPADRRRAQPAGRNAERRRAADARARASAREPPAAAAPRRALARARADHRPRVLPDRARAEQEEGLTVLVVEQNAKVALASRRRLRARGRAGRAARDERGAEGPRGRARLGTWVTDRRTFFQYVVSGSPTAASTRASRSRSCSSTAPPGSINFAQGEMAMSPTYIAWSLLYTAGLTYWLAFVAHARARVRRRACSSYLASSGPSRIGPS